MDRNRNPYKLDFERARNRISELQSELSSSRAKDLALIENLERQLLLLNQINQKQEEDIIALRELNKRQLTESSTPTKRAPNEHQSKEERIEALKLEAKALHKEHSVKHTDLSHAQTDKERFEIASEIMERIIPSLDSIYDNIRKLESGELEEEEQSSANTDFQRGVKTMKKIASLKVSISKAKRKLKKPLSEQEQTETKRALVKKEEELKELVKLIQ